MAGIPFAGSEMLHHMTRGGKAALEYQHIGTSLVVRPVGELDLVAAQEFKRLVDDLLDRRKVRNVYVNLEQVSFLDSSFLGALLGRYRGVSLRGGRMGIINPPVAIRPTLELSGIFRTMAEYRSEADALAAG
jgi:stage II sporulation protein AA (anti-sigma F factor antagonist)